jgi:transposase
VPAPRKYPSELHERPVRVVLEGREDRTYRRTRRCNRSVSGVGVNPETLRGWVKQPDIDAGRRPGPTSNAKRIKELNQGADQDIKIGRTKPP